MFFCILFALFLFFLLEARRTEYKGFIMGCSEARAQLHTGCRVSRCALQTWFVRESGAMWNEWNEWNEENEKHWTAFSPCASSSETHLPCPKNSASYKSYGICISANRKRLLESCWFGILIFVHIDELLSCVSPVHLVFTCSVTTIFLGTVWACCAS